MSDAVKLPPMPDPVRTALGPMKLYAEFQVRAYAIQAVMEDRGMQDALDGESMGLDRAIETAQLWRAGKMIVGDPYQVVFALLAEIERRAQKEPRAYPPLPKVGPICHAMQADVEEYKVPRIGKHLPGVYDIALWTTDQMRAYLDEDRAAAPKGTP